MRVSARRHLGRYADAETDTEQALRLESGNVEASLENGILHRLACRKDEARTSWLVVLRHAPGTTAACSARNYLQQMDGPER